MRNLFPTRAENLAIKPKVLVARTRKALDHHRERLSSLAAPYAEIDNSVNGALSELMAAFDDFEAHVMATAEWLEAEPGS